MRNFPLLECARQYHFSWQKIDRDLTKAATLFQEDMKDIDLIVVIADGGAMIYRLLKPKLENLIDPEVIEPVYIKLKRYTENGIKDAPINYQDVNETLISGKNILLFDEIVDKGPTISFAQEHLSLKGASSVRPFTIYKKSCADYDGDFVVEIDDRWVHFPWDHPYYSHKMYTWLANITLLDRTVDRWLK